MDTDDWRPIKTAPAEAPILLGRIEGQQIKRVGIGRISKSEHGKPDTYEWVYDVAPTHWKPSVTTRSHLPGGLPKRDFPI